MGRRIAIAVLGLAMITGCGQESVSGSSPTASPASPPAATATPTTAPVTPHAGAAALEEAFERVISRVLPSIVQINTADGLGSGVVYDTDGHIVTNAHVVGDGRRLQITLPSGGAPRGARLVAAFPEGDLAVIKADDPAGLTPATFGNSSRLRVGQIVLAMGNPLGFSGSVTSGIISALGRTVTEPQEAGSPGATITGAIQTSAPINPGNSGGALVNLSGEVIGIPTLAAVDPELGGGTAAGIGFAIPSNTAVDIADQIIRHGQVVNTRRAALGVRVSTVVGEDGRPAGVGVVSVERGSAAEKAGITPGDIIVSVNGTPTLSTQELAETLATLRPGQQAQVGVRRADGGTETLTVTLDELATNG